MLQTTADFFLEALCLLLYNHTDDTRKLIKEVLSIYTEERADEPEFQDAKIAYYCALLKDLLHGEVDMTNPAEMSAFKLKVIQNPELSKDTDLLERIRPMFMNDAKISPKRIQNLVQRVTTFIILHRSNKTIRKMFAKGRNAEDADPEKQQSLMNDVLEHARDICKLYDTVTLKEDSTVDMIDMSSRESIRRAILQNQKTRGSDTVWKLGLQGLNRAFTKWGGGIRRGTFGAVIACSHNYKSAMLMDMCRWFCMLNKPVLKPGTIPTIVFFSLENEIADNLITWFKSIYFNVYKASPPANMPTEDIINFVHERMSINGFKLLVYREIGEYFGLKEYQKKIKDLMDTGHDIQASFIDYMGLMKLDRDAMQENAAKARQMLAGNVAQFGKHAGITTITAWQLAGEADGIAASGNAGIVKKFGNHLLADAKGFARELDWQMFLHNEYNHAAVKFLTGRLYKLRYSEGGRSAEQDNWAYQFNLELGILDDIDGIDRSVADIYSVAEDGDGADRVFRAAG